MTGQPVGRVQSQGWARGPFPFRDGPDTNELAINTNKTGSPTGDPNISRRGAGLAATPSPATDPMSPKGASWHGVMVMSV